MEVMIGCGGGAITKSVPIDIGGTDSSVGKSFASQSGDPGTPST